MTALSDTFLPEFDKAKVPEATQARALQNTEVEEFVFPGEREPIHNADIALLKETFEEFERFRSRDRLVPSYHNVITLTSLQCYLKWMVIGLIPVDLPLFLGLTR